MNWCCNATLILYASLAALFLKVNQVVLRSLQNLLVKEWTLSIITMYTLSLWYLSNEMVWLNRPCITSIYYFILEQCVLCNIAIDPPWQGNFHIILASSEPWTLTERLSMGFFMKNLEKRINYRRLDAKIWSKWNPT